MSMEKNSDAIFGLLGLVGLVVGIGSLLIYVSLDRDIYIEKIRIYYKIPLDKPIIIYYIFNSTQVLR